MEGCLAQHGVGLARSGLAIREEEHIRVGQEGLEELSDHGIACLFLLHLGWNYARHAKRRGHVHPRAVGPSAPHLPLGPCAHVQLVVASDNDATPTLQVWDLRNSISPVKELTGHTKGVLSVAWCPSDPSLLASSGKDNRTIIWDVGTGEIMCELPAGSNWNFDLQWSKVTPGVISTSSYDSRVNIFNAVQDTAVSAAGATAALAPPGSWPGSAPGQATGVATYGKKLQLLGQPTDRALSGAPA